MRKFAKISAVLAAMVLALAFAGCKSDDDDDDDAKPIQAIVINGDVVTLYDDGTVIIKASDGTTSNGTYTKADGKIVIKDSKGNTTEAKSTTDGKVDTSEPVTIKDKDGNETKTEVKEKDTETNKGNGTSSTKNILAGKTYYSIDFEEKEYTSATVNRAKICISMVAFDSNGQKAKWTELKYDFKNGAVKKNEIIGPDEFNYSVSGSSLTVGGDNDPLIATIKSDGSIDGMKELKGNLYAFAEAEADSEELSAVAYIIIVDGTACNLEQHTCSSKNGLDDPYVLGGTVSGSTLEFTDEKKDGQTVTVSCKLSDKEIKVNDSPDGPITLKRM
ncbi:MAG: hypothetical protein SOV76_09725 [Treponema succinifaciens]|uniref:hypothetical protein n=1 Tax=Treponema succinifaciens TaxID=167 RepID=UPI002A75F6FA|nr:hypothetical protein [Treponema succinifaciens]MDY2616813.1 hypothetical protein [Treponema succinifaciens]